MKWLPLLNAILPLCVAFGASDAAYRVENIPTPAGLVAKTGGLAFLPDGHVAACFQFGEIYLYDPAKKSWQLFAEGLHDPLGLVAISNSEIIVMQRPELTRLRDTDGDGVADQYETICNTFGITGNYHEFAFGPLLDHDGDFLVGLNTASSLAGIHNELRGTFNSRGRAGRMYSCVPWRGWIVKITPDGQLTPFASGFRSPNGLGYDASGNLFVPDNQGDWIGSSTLCHVEPGKFYGHPASLVWQEGETRDPQTIPLAELDARRTRPSVVFPQDIMANSPAQPLLDATGGKFGPFTGQLLLGEMNRARILRVALEKVDGQFQGMCVPLLDDQGLRKGNNRLAFAADGSLWVGQTDHGWAGDQGLQRIVWTGAIPFDVLTMHVTRSGFEVVFTRPVAEASAAAPDAWKIARYNYDYHAAYGSKQHDRETVAVTSVRFSPDHLRATIEFASLTAWRIYEFHLDALRTDDGTSIANPLICYTLNRLLENTPRPPPPGREASAKDNASD